MQRCLLQPHFLACIPAVATASLPLLSHHLHSDVELDPVPSVLYLKRNCFHLNLFLFSSVLWMNQHCTNFSTLIITPALTSDRNLGYLNWQPLQSSTSRVTMAILISLVFELVLPCQLPITCQLNIIFAISLP